eukprot:8062198-Pyramimonas_sp.AAC.1
MRRWRSEQHRTPAGRAPARRPLRGRTRCRMWAARWEEASGADVGASEAAPGSSDHYWGLPTACKSEHFGADGFSIPTTSDWTPTFRT